MEYYIHEAKESYSFQACQISNIETSVEIDGDFWTVNTDFVMKGDFNLPDQLINVNYVTSFAKITNIACLQTSVKEGDDLNTFKYHSSYLFNISEYDYFDDPIYQQFINFSTYFTFNTALASQYEIDDTEESDSDFIADVENTLYDQEFKYNNISFINDNQANINIIDQLNNTGNKTTTIKYRTPSFLDLDNFTVIHDLFSLQSDTPFDVTEVDGEFHFYLNNDLDSCVKYDYHDLHKYLNIKKLTYQINDNLIIQNDGFQTLAKESGLSSIIAGNGDYHLAFVLRINNIEQTVNISNDFSFANNLFDSKHVNFKVVKKNFVDLTDMVDIYNDD